MAGPQGVGTRSASAPGPVAPTGSAHAAARGRLSNPAYRPEVREAPRQPPACPPHPPGRPPLGSSAPRSRYVAATRGAPLGGAGLAQLLQNPTAATLRDCPTHPPWQRAAAHRIPGHGGGGPEHHTRRGWTRAPHREGVDPSTTQRAILRGGGGEPVRAKGGSGGAGLPRRPAPRWTLRR